MKNYYDYGDEHISVNFYGAAYVGKFGFEPFTIIKNRYDSKFYIFKKSSELIECLERQETDEEIRSFIQSMTALKVFTRMFFARKEEKEARKNKTN